MAKPPKLSKEAARAISAGSSFFGILFGGFLLGKLFETLFVIYPYGSIAGTIVGFILGNFSIYKILLVSK